MFEINKSHEEDRRIQPSYSELSAQSPDYSDDLKQEVEQPS
jgi:hypothetical protein